METKLKICHDGKPDVELTAALSRTLAIFNYDMKEQQWYTKENYTNLIFEKKVEQE